jgi:hypothetical protein
MTQNKINNLYNTPINSNGSIKTIQGLSNQVPLDSKIPYDPYRNAEEKEYLETIALAADLLAGGVISSQDFFKLKLLLTSKDEEVRNTGIIFLNQKAKL